MPRNVLKEVISKVFVNYLEPEVHYNIQCCNFLAGFLQVSHMVLIHLLNICKKSLTSLKEVTNNNFIKYLSSHLQEPDKS